VEGANLGKSFDCPFIEASAKQGTNVDEVFMQLVREVKKNDEGKGKTEKKKKKCVIM
jgi:hypothetical protein